MNSQRLDLRSAVRGNVRRIGPVREISHRIRVVPGGAVFARVAGGALVMMVIAVATQWPRLRQVSTHTRTVPLYGVFAISGVQLCFFNAVQHLSVGVALLLEYLAPIIVIGWVWITKGARPSVQTLLGAAVALIGAAVVIDVFGSAEISAVGVAWGLAAAACLAVYFVISERADGDLHPVVLAASGLTVSAVVIGALGLVGVLPSSSRPRTPSWQTIR
ncbi:EamA family transporter [Rhodococcus sp. 3Y1]